jgi:hypothetical protein
VSKADGKLIPVKTPEVGYADIPLPFGEMHTENVGSTALIRAAVVAQLAKPVVQPSPLTLLTKEFKWELLTWWGIIGGAVTLFSAYSAAITLAPWARWLVEHWKEWAHATWAWLFGWLGIRLSPASTSFLSYLLFWSLLTIGQAVKFYNQPIADKYRGGSWRLASWQTLFVIILYPVVATLVLIALFFAERFLQVHVPLFTGSVIITVLVYEISLVPLARERLNAALTIFIMSIFSSIIIRPSAADPDPDDDIAFLVAVSMQLLLPLILLSVAPAKAVSRRLIFLVLGLLILIALNELSKLGLD